MSSQKALSNWVVGAGTVMVAFAVPHFVDDFLYGIPAEFGLTNPQAQALGGLFFAMLTVILVMVRRRLRIGYYGTLCFGIFPSGGGRSQALGWRPCLGAVLGRINIRGVHPGPGSKWGCVGHRLSLGAALLVMRKTGPRYGQRCRY